MRETPLHFVQGESGSGGEEDEQEFNDISSSMKMTGSKVKDASVSLEKLLEIESLDNEPLVSEIVEQSARLFWKTNFHPFCDFNQAHHAYRFLYGFIYDHKELNRFVSDEILAQCGECLLGYIQMRRRFFIAMSLNYDESGLSDLYEEFLIWDLARIQLGLACAPSTTSSAGVVDPKVFPNALLELFMDIDRLLSHSIPSTSCNGMIKGIIESLGSLVPNDLKQAARHLVFSQRDVFPPCLIKAWTSPVEVVRNAARVATSVIGTDDFMILNDPTICPCPKRFKEVLKEWSEEIKRLCDLTQLSEKVATAEENYDWEVMGSSLAADQKSCQRIHIVLSSLQELIKASAIPMNEFYFQPLNSISVSVVFILQMARSLLSRMKNESFHFFEVVLLSLELVQSFCINWSPQCPIFFCLKDDSTTDNRENDGVNATSVWLILLKNLWASPALETFQLSLLQTIREFLHLISRENLLRSNLNVNEVKLSLNVMLELCFARVQSAFAQSIQEVNERQRDGLRISKRRILFLVIALDCQLSEPDGISETAAQKPLVLKYQIKLSQIFQQVLKSGNFAVDDLDFEKIVAFAMEKLFDWAITDFKFEVTVLQTQGIQFCNYLSFLLDDGITSQSTTTLSPIPIPKAPSFRSSFLLHTIPQFITIFHAHPQLGETAIINRLRHLADMSGFGTTLQAITVIPYFQNQNPKIAGLLKQNGEEGELEEIALRLKVFGQCFIDCYETLELLTSVGTFGLQCVIDRFYRLYADLSTSPTQFSDPSCIDSTGMSNSKIALPVVNSLVLPGRTSNPTHVEQWPVDFTDLTTANPIFIARCVEALSENPLMLVVQQFLPVILCGRSEPKIHTRCNILAQLLSPRKLHFEATRPSSIIPLQYVILSYIHESSPILEVGDSVDLSIVTSLSEWIDYGTSQQRIGLLESLCITAEVLLDSVALQSEVELHCHSLPTDHAQTACYRDPLLGPPILWSRWLGIIGLLIPSIENVGKSLLEDNEDDTDEVEKYTELIGAIWKIVVQTLLNGPHQLDESSRNLCSLAARTFHPSAFSTLLFDFLQRWTASIITLLDVASARDQTFRPGCSSPAAVSIHVDAFIRHPKWVPRLTQWCIMTQAALADQIVAEGSTTAEILVTRWRRSETGQQIQKLCSNVARAMTLVHKRFRQPMERGSPVLMTLGIGEIAPVVLEILNSKNNDNLVSFKSTTKVVPSGATTTQSLSETKTLVRPLAPSSYKPAIKKTLFDYFTVNDSPVSSEAEDSVNTLNVSSTVKSEFSRSTPTGMPFGGQLVQANKRRDFDFFSTRKQRFLRDSGQKTAGRIPSSLIRKLGGDDGPRISSLRLPPNLQIKRPPLSAIKKRSTATTTSSSSGSSTVGTPPLSLGSTKIAKSPPSSSSSTIQTTVSANKATISIPVISNQTRPKSQSGQRHAIQSDDPRIPIPEKDHGGKMDPTQKKIAVEKAQAGLQNMLRDILDWDIFNLEGLQLPQLSNLPDRLPLTFDDAETFRACFKPLVLEECRCSIIQGSVERKLQGFPVKIMRSTRLSKDILATARSDKTSNEQQLTDQQVQNKDLDPMALQPWDLVLLVPRVAIERDGSVIVGSNKDTNDGCEGRIFADLKEPPLIGYAVAVVEKDEEKETMQWGTRKILTAKLRMPFISPTQHLRRIPTSRVTINSVWTAYVIGSLTTSVREFQSLFMSQFSPLFPFILNPRKFGCRKPPNGITSSTDSECISPGWLTGILTALRKRCNLNDSQLSALRYALSFRYGVALLQGPPGTGKTKTLLAILAAVYYRLSKSKSEAGVLKKKILVCAPSNAAVDEIAARVLKEGFPALDEIEGIVHPQCVRVGNPKRVTRPEVLEISLEETLHKTVFENDKAQKDYFFSKREDLRARLDALDVELTALDSLRQAEKVQNAFSETPGDRPIARQFEELLKQKRFLHQQKVRLKDEFDKSWKTSKSTTRDSMLRDADIVFATLSSSATETLSSIEFDCVITDEAAQAVELSALIPLRLEPPRLILIGDPQQLPATVLSKVARKFSYERSLFQRLQACGVGVKMLLMQYRMRPEISAFPAAHFYQNRLRNAPSVLTRPPLRMHNWTNLFRPFLFFDIPSAENRNSATQSLSNQGEAFFVFSLVRLLVKYFLYPRSAAASNLSNEAASNGSSYDDSNIVGLSDVAIVTPYRQQVIELRRLFESLPSEFPPDQPEVCTIDAFQGREKRIIIFSCVRSSAETIRRRRFVGDGEQSSISSSDEDEDSKIRENENDIEIPLRDISALGFVADVRRLNVAVTRARDCLWVVGNMRTLKCDPVWRALINYARGKHKIHDKTCEEDQRDRPSSRDKKKIGKRSFVDVMAEAHRLQVLLCQPSQRRSLGYSNPSIVISVFLSLSEEYYLKQEQNRRRSEETQNGPTSTELVLLNSRTMGNDYSGTPPTIEHGQDAQTNGLSESSSCLVRRVRTLSNCSSITSSSSASSGDVIEAPSQHCRIHSEIEDISDYNKSQVRTTTNQIPILIQQQHPNGPKIAENAANPIATIATSVSLSTSISSSTSTGPDHRKRQRTRLIDEETSKKRVRSHGALHPAHVPSELNMLSQKGIVKSSPPISYLGTTMPRDHFIRCPPERRSHSSSLRPPIMIPGRPRPKQLPIDGHITTSSYFARPPANFSQPIRNPLSISLSYNSNQPPLQVRPNSGSGRSLSNPSFFSRSSTLDILPSSAPFVLTAPPPLPRGITSNFQSRRRGVLSNSSTGRPFPPHRRLPPGFIPKS